MSHGIDAWVEEMKPSGCEPMLNRILTKLHLEQLSPSHHPVLPLRQPRHLSIDRPLSASPRETAYIAVNGGLAGHARSVPGKSARVARRSQIS